MPIYEYACKSCNTDFEILVINPQEKVACPHCNGDKLEKLISAHSVGTHIQDAVCEPAACGTGACPACQ